MSPRILSPSSTNDDKRSHCPVAGGPPPGAASKAAHELRCGHERFVGAGVDG